MRDEINMRFPMFRDMKRKAHVHSCISGYDLINMGRKCV